MVFKFKKTKLKDVLIIEPSVILDSRGFFIEIFKESDFKDYIKKKFVQENHSQSKKNTLRGLHYQLNPKAQAKLVRCIKGSMLCVAVDIRKNSITYTNWISEILSEKNKKMLYIPEGFAHGVLALEDDAEVIYKCTEEYSLDNEASIFWNDPEININWGVKNPILSDKDLNAPLLKNAKNNFKVKK
jgi:dTDP-4-dehydrorhamnose 3,5-epimerase